MTSEICRHFPELSDEIKFATVPRSQKEEEEEEKLSPRTSQSSTVEATTPEEGPETENEPSVVNGEENTAEPEDDTDKPPVFENDDASSADRAAPVTTRINRRRTGSLRSIRKRLSVQRRSTIGVGDNRNFSDEDIQTEVCSLDNL